MKPESNDKELQFMPVLSNKRPIHQAWEKTRTEYDYSRAEAIGLVCGEISGYAQAIDIDTKYDLTGTLFERYKKAIYDADPEILKKLVVQKTMSGGYHFIFKCKDIEGNKKLAQRYTSEEERVETFKSTYESSLVKCRLDNSPDPEIVSNERANNAMVRDKIRVLIETRGEHGYIVVAPSNGYSIVYGSLDNIQEITSEERALLYTVSYSFNEVIVEHKPKARIESKRVSGLSPFEDYNQRGDVVGLLETHGWQYVSRKGNKLLMLRPGDTKATHSGNYDEEKRWFSVFSTSTEFQPQAAYQPYAVYATLECNSDYTEASRKLYDLGYGERLETAKENIVKVASIIDITNDDFSFLAEEEDYMEYLGRWRTGTFEMGKTTGIPELDGYFRFKPGNLVIVNGIDNVGKSTVVWYLATLSNVYNGWKWLIFSAENKVGSVVRRLIEFYIGKPIDRMTEEEYKKALAWQKESFSIIKMAKGKLYNYMDILNMATKAMTRKKYHGLMIDPYNALIIDIPIKSKQGTYEYHYEAASYMQMFGQQNEMSVWLNCHVGTAAARNKDQRTGYTKAPQKEDTEMGVMFANKADDFLTIHRITQSEDEWMYTELHVRKIKETETGGRVTPYYKPIDLRMVPGMCGFEQCMERNPAPGYNPIKMYHHKQGTPMPGYYTPVNAQDDEDPF